MFPEMRRIKRQMSDKDAIKVLEEGIDGVLGTISENGYPYTVPVNYVYTNNKVYFHCAFEGHKLRNIKVNNKVSFTVITKNDIMESEFSTDYQSVILFGKAKIVEPSKEILMALIKKYSMNFLEKGKKYVDNEYLTTQIVEIEIEHITGKERKKR